VKSLDSHKKTVKRLWPDAVQQFVRSHPGTGIGCGLVYRVGDRIVAEVRDATGRQGYQEWIATPELKG
jgi:hypothetical protein